MIRQERIGDPNESLLLAMTAWQAGLWTALPAFVIDYNPDQGTITAQATIKIKRFFPDGSSELVTIPPLGDVPVIFPGGGGYSLTFPISPGDECLVVFASRCIDDWWQSGGIGKQIESRMHDLSDGFAIFGPRSKPNVLPGANINNVQLRSDDGALYIELAAGHVANVVAPGGLNITGPVNIIGDVAVVGDADITGDTNFTGQVHANTHAIDETHLHSGVTAGGANTGPVTP